MSLTLSDPLRPPADGMQKVVREIEILRISADLDNMNDKNALETARKEVMIWAKNRAGAEFPQAAWNLPNFEHLAGGHNSVAVRYENGPSDIWALRADDPDKTVPGRVWTTEVIVGCGKDGRLRFSARLLMSTKEHEPQFEPHVPGFVLQLAEKPGLVRGGRIIKSQPHRIADKHAAEDLCDYLVEENRRIPVILITSQEDAEEKYIIDGKDLAKALTGLARVYLLPACFTWELTDRFGKFRSVFGGAVRVYMPGFSESDDPYRHRLFLLEHLETSEYAKVCQTWLKKASAMYSVNSNRLGREIFDFASVRTASRKLKSRNLLDASASDSDRLKIATEIHESLDKALEEKNKEIDGYVDLVAEAEDRASTSEQEHRALLYHCQYLESQLENSDSAEVHCSEYPQKWQEFMDWVDTTYPDKILFTPRARKMIKKPEFEDVAQVSFCIKWLATEGRDKRIHGGGKMGDDSVIEGVVNARCGGDAYTIDWHGRSYDVDSHIKSGGNTRNPKRCLRIYYFWEPETKLIVIDHLPAHKKTGMT